MSRRLAGAVVALILAGSAGTGLLAMQNKPQSSDAPEKSPEAIATEALNSALKRLARNEYDAALKDFETAKKAYMHLFVHDRTASNMLMKAMKTWVEERRAKPADVEPSAIAAFDAWVRERDTLAASVGNLGHNSPDWK
jgi:hypothetical protein